MYRGARLAGLLCLQWYASTVVLPFLPERGLIHSDRAVAGVDILRSRRFRCRQVDIQHPYLRTSYESSAGGPISNLLSSSATIAQWHGNRDGTPSSAVHADGQPKNHWRLSWPVQYQHTRCSSSSDSNRSTSTVPARPRSAQHAARSSAHCILPALGGRSTVQYVEAARVEPIRKPHLQRTDLTRSRFVLFVPQGTNQGGQQLAYPPGYWAYPSRLSRNPQASRAKIIRFLSLPFPYSSGRTGVDQYQYSVLGFGVAQHRLRARCRAWRRAP